jgi:hypothetical protein
MFGTPKLNPVPTGWEQLSQPAICTCGLSHISYLLNVKLVTDNGLITRLLKFGEPRTMSETVVQAYLFNVGARAPSLNEMGPFS